MIQQLKEGDQKVLGEVYRQYRSDFIAWMHAKYGCSQEEARDIYQNTMLTLSIKAQNGTLPDLKSSLKTYIYGIAKNKYKEYQRSNGRFVHVEDDAWKEMKEEEKEEANLENKQLVRRCLQKLGDPCKSVLELYYFHGLSMEEIKDHLTYKNSRTAKNMKYKCLQRLREIFQKEMERKTSAHEQPKTTMKNLKNIAKIEQYLRGDLSEPDMIDLEVRLLEDEDFRKEFQTMQVLVSGIKDSGRKSTLQEKLDRLKPSASPLKVLRGSKNGAKVISLSQDRRRLLYPMGVALLIALIVIVLFPFGKNWTPEQMFAENFEISPNLDYRSSRGADWDPAITEAYRAYDQGDYTQASKLLEDLVQSDPDRLTHQFYLGNCYLKMEKWDQAISSLQEPAYASIPISDDAKWYLGLAYFRVGDTANTIPLLKQTTRMLEREKKARKMLRQIED